MKKTKNHSSSVIITSERSPLLGDYAHQVIKQHYRHIVRQERRVLSDKNPEPLHQMRVGTRRLRTALEVFDGAIALPKAAQVKRLSRLGKVLGKLRDLDVQISTLRQDFYPQLDEAHQTVTTEAIAQLTKRRRKAFAGTQDALSNSAYKTLKTTYEQWLIEPQFTSIAQLPLTTVLPELLTPLLTHLLLHPAWLVSTPLRSEDDSLYLHDLRKAFKQARYQAEFFTDFYGQDFQAWVDELKMLQEALGEVQDGQILLELLTDEMPKATNLDAFHTIINETQIKALFQWESVREKYLDPTFRRHLHRLILMPVRPMPSELEKS